MSKIVREYANLRLQKQSELSLLRGLQNPKEGLIDFSSNDYLGLARSEELFDQIESMARKHFKRNGSTGSRLLSGNFPFMQDVERFVAGYLMGDAALIFNSGYTANLAVLSSLPGRGDTILYDELAHASLKDGARLSQANRFSFRHNSLIDLQSKLERSRGRAFIVVESIYSMDGDEAPLREICNLARQYDAAVILDEAHSTGVIGEGGRGMAVRDGVTEQILVRIHTFGKALGTHGASVICTPEIREYFINFARPFIYSTALAPHAYFAIREAIAFMAAHPELQDRLQENVMLFVEAFNERGNSRSPIQTKIVPGNQQVRLAAMKLSEAGYDIRPILSPTVTKGLERLRICIHAFNKPEDVKRLAETLNII